MDRRERANTQEEILRMAFDSMTAGMWSALPGIIQSFDPVKMTCVVQISIQGRQFVPGGNAGGFYQMINIKPLCDCPVIFPSGGGFTLTFPLAQGDECLMVFADRCIDAWWQQGGIQPPMELRMHDLSDGFVLPGVRSQPRVLDSISATSTQLRSDDGETYLDLSPGKIQLVADEVVIHGRLKTAFDAGGTGFVYQPAQIDTYTTGVPSSPHAPNPPEVPT